MTTHLLKFVLLLLLASLLLSCNKPPEWHATDITGSMPDLEFNLVGPRGKNVDARSLHGKPVLLTFGFSNCPHICPTTMTQLSVVMKKLGKRADDVQVLLVTVDPQRDTPEVLEKFTTAFGPWFTGLTGSEEALERLRKSYGVYAAMESSVDKGTYNVMHSIAVFVFDRQGRIRLLMSNISNADAVAEDIRTLLRL